jgi:beta-glucosidase
LHGYTLLEEQGVAAAYPFGFGLSYAAFSYRGLKVRRAHDRLDIEVAVRNDGEVAGDEITQLYIGFPGVQAKRPRKLLKAFARTQVPPGQTEIIHFQVALEDLRWWDLETRKWLLEPGVHKVYVGGSSVSAEALCQTIVIS